jgi:tetratricopeptide (TPR) repeat protein
MALPKEKSSDTFANSPFARMLFMVVVVVSSIRPLKAQMTLTYNTDSLKKVLSTDLADTNRIWALDNLGRNIRNIDSVLLLAEQAITLSQKAGFIKGEAEAYNNIAYWFNQNGNYPKALENYLRSIKLSDSIDYELGLNRSFNSIATVYLYLKDYSTSMTYARKARVLSLKLRDPVTYAVASSWLSKSFIELHQKDSALKYGQESFEAATRTRKPFPLYVSTARLGEIHAMEGNMSLEKLYMGISLCFFIVFL